MRNNEILMPALSPTMEEGTLAKWLVKVGDKISSGDLIAEIETDKATMEIEAIEEGFISKLIVEEGTQGVKINTPIAEFSETENFSETNYKEGEIRPKNTFFAGGCVLVNTEINHRVLIKKSDEGKLSLFSCYYKKIDPFCPYEVDR